MKTKKNYYFKHGKPIHHISCCAFLDVLGFSKRIDDSFVSENGDILLQEFHKIFVKQVNLLREDSFLYMKSFTDNIILASPRFTNDLESEVFFIVESISNYQFEMAQHGFFIRGGLSAGPLFIDDNSVYGPALLIAHHIERDIAVNPIVVLSDNVKKLVFKHVNFYASKKIAPQNIDILVNADGNLFINYLSECYIYPDYANESMEINWNALKIHKEQIEKSLNVYQADPYVFAKFSWLAEYHNYFCDSVKFYSGYNSNLKISSTLSKVQFKDIATTDFLL